MRQTKRKFRKAYVNLVFFSSYGGYDVCQCKSTYDSVPGYHLILSTVRNLVTIKCMMLIQEASERLQ